MLTEERFSKILEKVNSNGSATVPDLMRELNASESTIRRDLQSLDAEGRLIKVRGGAIAANGAFGMKDNEVDIRKELNAEAKLRIAKYAAGLIRDDDLVYIDGGTTTGMMIRFMDNKEAFYVTNALLHAKEMAERGLKTFVVGGEYKSMTEVVVGEEACASIAKYNFTKGFFGSNGIDCQRGFSTPEIREAVIKQQAMKRCHERYILADKSKFGQAAKVTFGSFEAAEVITEHIPEEYRKYSNIREV